MRTTKNIFGREVQFRLERSSWHREMTLHVLPSITVMYLSGWGADDKLCFPGFWNIEFAWIKFSFTICINDK